MINSIYSDKTNGCKERNYTTRPSDLNVINKKTIAQRLLMAFIVIAMFSTKGAVVHAKSGKKYESEIDKISQQIKKVSDDLNSNKKLLKSEQHQMFEVEKKIKGINFQINESNRKIKQQEEKVAELESQAEELKQQQQGNKQALSDLVLNQYKRGKSHHLKTLLNQQSPYALGRLNNYYEYYYQAYAEKMTEIKSQIEDYQLLQNQRLQEVAELSVRQERQKEQQQSLTQNKQQRKTLLTQLNQKVDKSGSKLKKLKQDKERLNKLLTQIALQAEKLRIERERQKQLEAKRERESTKEAIAKEKRKRQSTKDVIPKPSSIVKGGFSKQKGHLSLPVAGKIKQQYNSRIAESGMRSDGLMIETKTAQKVAAVFKGQVVFADWLKGYGLLLIIDHGENHLSLYGHNEVLYKKAGDEVVSNELIAKTGTTGGLITPALYFEIRKNAVPVDPNLWCK